MSGKTCCFMDPVMFSPFEAGANRFDPSFRIDQSAVRELCNLIVLSHHHGDHFCPRSLNLLRRSCPVVYPRGAHLLERSLRRLGFELLFPLDTGARLEVGGLKLTATGSLVSFPEMGIVFQADARVFWNPVDSIIDESIIGAARAAAGRPDVLFANYQPLIEGELQEDALGAPFPFTTYGDYLRQVWTIRPRCVVPGSFGAGYTEEWLNQRGIPMTAAQFMEDLAQIEPELRSLQLSPGDVLDLGEQLRVEPQGLTFVTPTTATSAPEQSHQDWRPDLGVPPLVDRNSLGFPVDELRAQVDEILSTSFLQRLANADQVWLEKLARLRVIWRLEIVYPGGELETRLLDFSRTPFAWGQPRDDAFAKLHTSVTASSLVALEAALINSYAMSFNQLRMVNRLYEVHRGGVSWAGGRSEEPITRVLLKGADDRYVDRQIAEILTQASSP